MSVFVPSQRQRPAGCGLICAGTFRAASSCEVTATTGREKVRETCGARGTSPSGEWRKTFASPATTSGDSRGSGAGKGFNTVAPARGAGSERSRSANS